MNKNNKIELQNIRKHDYKFLYELLAERDQIVNISHKKMPTFKQHVKFVMSNPYSKWYIVYYNDEKVGTAYLSKQDEIGIHIKKTLNDSKIRQVIMNMVMQKNSRKRYLANVNPCN